MNTTTLNRMQPWGLTVLRILTGIIFLMHAWQKITMFGLAGFTGFLTSLGVPAASFMAMVVIALELLGGIALVLGLGTRYVTLPLAFSMLVALFTAHLPSGFFASDGGYELVLLLMGVCVALFFTGSGAFALDNIVRGRLSPARTATAV